jgi:serine/threonine-protein kinase
VAVDTAGLTAGTQFAGYALRRCIGQGSHGSVYLAEHIGLGQVVALKLVRLPAGPAAAAAAAAFLRHAESVRRLRHPDIVTLHAAGTERGLGWLAMEAVPGTDLTRYTAPARLLPELLVVRTIRRVAAALGAAHRQGVVHRDVKPANVMVDWPSDTVKLADFGLARADDGLQTGTGIVPGTPAYMPPEQLAGALPTSCSDLYALGVTLFQLLAGRLPHEATSMGALLRQVAEGPVPDLHSLRPGLPAGLTALVGRLLARRIAERPADAAAVSLELAALADEWPFTA